MNLCWSQGDPTCRHDWAEDRKQATAAPSSLTLRVGPGTSARCSLTLRVGPATSARLGESGYGFLPHVRSESEARDLTEVHSRRVKAYDPT